VAIAIVGFVVATLIPDQTVSIVGFFLIGLGVATFMPKLYDDAARLPGRRGAGLGAMTAGMRIAFLLTPVFVGGLAGTSLSVGQAVAIYSLPAAVGLVVVTEWNERLLRRKAGASG
jgi:predicted MFS family arabinose efflux permease